MASKNKLFSVHAIIRLLLLLCVSGNLLAQNKLPDIELDPVEITENRISPFAIGAHTTAFDSTLSNLKAGNNVADLVANYTAISLKSYGNGMLSTISMRGTGPEHTAVLWHGINISYPMLGQSDLSVLSLAFADKIIIQHGANSALYGSGAIGGTVSLENLEPVKGVNLSLSQWFGSFGTLSNNLKASFNTDKYFIKINTLWNQSENNFAFKNTTKVGIPVEKQNGANYNILGTSVDAGLRLSKGKMLMLSGQYFNADRNIQPSMNANTSGDNQMDENIRVRVGYSHQKVKSEWELSYAYLHDVIGFNGEETIADQHIVRSKFTHQLLNKIKLNAGIDYNRINIQAKFYIDEGKLENRANLWSSVLFNPIPRFLLSINLRQSFNPDYKIPFTQSIGAEYLLVNSAKHQLRLQGLFSEGYRVPTINERFWIGWGNPDIEPEESYSVEMGFEGESDKTLNYTYNLTVYRMWADNWIQWAPNGSIWSPQNIVEVDAYGLEVSNAVEHPFVGGKIKWMGDYAFTRTIKKSGLDSFDRSVGKQLTYVPIHKASLTSLAELKEWFFVVNASYTSKRYVTADNEDYLTGYALLNLRVGKNFKWSKYLIRGNLNINNLLNTQYQSIVNKAMPGINFLAGITINYHKL